MAKKFGYFILTVTLLKNKGLQHNYKNMYFS